MLRSSANASTTATQNCGSGSTSAASTAGQGEAGSTPSALDFNKSNIRPGDAAVLDEAASALKANPGVTANVNGYCDAVGSVKYNQKLSERRAESVVKYLVKAGIPEDRLVPHGFGKTDFVATNDTAEGRAQNRRVELVPAQ